jgi:hypothetical protein
LKKSKPLRNACKYLYVNFLLTLPSAFMITRMTEQIDQFFRPDGTLISIPVKLHKKLAVLRHIASELSPDTKYPEKQLNEIIAKYHPDTAALRRYMIEYGILERDGESVYWVIISD